MTTIETRSTIKRNKDMNSSTTQSSVSVGVLGVDLYAIQHATSRSVRWPVRRHARSSSPAHLDQSQRTHLPRTISAPCRAAPRQLLAAKLNN